MYSKLSQKITQKFAEHNIIDDEKSEIYKYGLELMLSLVFTVTVILITSVLVNKILETVLFLAGFFAARIICGGYHAKHHYSCFITSISMYIAFLLFHHLTSQHLRLNLIFALMSVVSIILIIAFAPVEHPDNPMTEYRKSKNRLLSYLLSCIIIFFLVISSLVKKSIIVLLPLNMGIFFAALAILAAKVETVFLKRKEENR